MSNERIGLVVGAVAALVLAFVVLSPGDDDEPATVTTPTVAAPATTADEGEPATTTATTPEFEFARIRVRNGEPGGGVQTITVKKGDRARIEVTTQDTSDEIHLHGYDLTRDLNAGDSARFSFVADAEGIFEIELHATGTQIGRLVVEP